MGLWHTERYIREGLLDLDSEIWWNAEIERYGEIDEIAVLYRAVHCLRAIGFRLKSSLKEIEERIPMVYSLRRNHHSATVRPS
jgi:hypothetical protein